MIKEVGNVRTTGAPLLKKAIIACGQVVMNVDGGVRVISISNVKSASDIIIVSLVSDDSGFSIVSVMGAVTVDGQITITVTDDVASADDSVVNYVVIRQVV